MAKQQMARSKARRAAATRAKSSARRRRSKPVVSIGKYMLPGILCLVLFGALVFMGVAGYRTVTASEFFEVRAVQIVGLSRASKDEINKIVDSMTGRTGAWNADLADLRGRVEKVTFVRSATVSRVLPNGIRVDIVEKTPEAIVKLSSGNFLVDANGEIITAAGKDDKIPAVIRGWDEAKSEKAFKGNAQRIKIYQSMVNQWKEFGLLQRVKEVNLTEPQEPHVIIEDSGVNINVALAKDDLGKSLKSAVEAVAGKGEKVRSVNAAGVYPVIEYLSY